MNTSAHSAVDTLHAALPSEELEMSQIQSVKSVYVYEAPVRFWHWVNALAITVLLFFLALANGLAKTVEGSGADDGGFSRLQRKRQDLQRRRGGAAVV